MVLLDMAMATFYRLSIVIFSLCATVSPQFLVESFKL